MEPSGLQHGLEDVLIILETVHQTVPDVASANQPVYLAPPPPGQPADPAVAPAPQSSGTEADKLRETYKSLGEQQNHTFGVGAPGSPVSEVSSGSTTR